MQELEARGVTLSADVDVDRELRAGRCFRLDRDMFGVDSARAAHTHHTLLYLEKAMAPLDRLHSAAGGPAQPMRKNA